MSTQRRRGSRAREPRISVFRAVPAGETPPRFSGKLCPTNMQEQKERFLKYGIAPKFTLRADPETLERLNGRTRAQIRFDYFTEARAILETVKREYGDGTDFLAQALGDRIDCRRASHCLAVYLKENGLEGNMTVYWAPDLTCSARMMWHGPSIKYNRPEARQYSLIIKNNEENHFLRDNGIMCLADHEIGTHYFRMLNDGLQPWFSCRKRFGLRPMGCREGVASEEGLAALNTLLHANSKHLWSAALLYYTACKASDMTFRQLFDHLATYVTDPDQRWRHVMRVKRSLADPTQPGGYGNDQCYFEGAVDILRHMDTINFPLMWSGRVCWDEIARIHRLARMDCARMPHFLRDLQKYKRILHHIGVVNGLRQQGICPALSSRQGNKQPKSHSKQLQLQSRNACRIPPTPFKNMYRGKPDNSCSPRRTPSDELTRSPSPMFIRFDPAISPSVPDYFDDFGGLDVSKSGQNTPALGNLQGISSMREMNSSYTGHSGEKGQPSGSPRTSKAQKITNNIVREIVEKYFTS